MTQPAPPTAVDAAAVHRWVTAGCAALEAARSEIDGLNVYPVPDGDTGTNLHLTVEAAREALAEAAQAARPGEALAVAARGALLGARGNSGVILSQVLRGMADATSGAGERLDPRAWADALRAGADAAYAAVAQPVEGTMLTVAREAAAGAVEHAPLGLGDMVTAAADAARRALARTPDQLETLRLAGVVDAGGRGVCVLLDALVEVLTGAVAPAPAAPVRDPGAPAPAAPDVHAEPRGGPAYEVMYLLAAPAGAIPPLRAALAGLGDSLVVVGGEPTWNVHVHVDDPGAAVEAGVEAGRPHRIKVT